MTTSLNDVLSALDTAMGVVKTVAQTPGISVLPYASTVAGAITAIQAAEAAGRDIAPYVQAINDTFGADATVPTTADMAALDARIAELDALVDAPLPPKEAGEPD
jgi:hypothetical protein